MPKVTPKAIPVPPVTNSPQWHIQGQNCICWGDTTQHMTVDVWEKAVLMFRANMDIKHVQLCASFIFLGVT